MAKSKKKSRASRARLNPLRNAQKSTTTKDTGLVTRKIQPLVKQLQSAVPSERNIALSSISVLCDDPHMRQLFLKERLLQVVLSNLLNDDNADIVIEAYGLLRNIALDEGYDASIFLWRNNVWTSIQSGLQQVVTSLDTMGEQTSSSSSSHGHDVKNAQSRRLVFEYADNLLSLVVALSDSATDILDQILEKSNLELIINVLLKLTHYGFEKLPSMLQNTMLDLIYDFTSQSMDFIDSLLACQPLVDFIAGLHDLEKQEQVGQEISTTGGTSSNELREVLTQGIMLQLYDADPNSRLNTTQCAELLTNVMNAVASINVSETVETLMRRIDEEINVNKLKEYTKNRADAVMRYQAIEIALDVITGTIEIIASSDIKVDGQLDEILESQLPQFFNALFEGFTEKVLVAWNNLLWLFVNLDRVVDQTLLQKLWDDIVSLEDRDDTDVKMGKVSVMWVILKICGLQGADDLLQQFKVWNNMEFVDAIIKQFNESDDTEYRDRCCGLLAVIASYQSQDYKINQRIGQFFMELLVSDTIPVEILVDVTHSLFGIYGDCNFDYDLPVFVNGGFLNILREKVVPNLKRRFKMVDKNKTPELKSRCTNCFNTLDSFIHYKANERS